MKKILSLCDGQVAIYYSGCTLVAMSSLNFSEKMKKMVRISLYSFIVNEAMEKDSIEDRVFILLNQIRNNEITWISAKDGWNFEQ